MKTATQTHIAPAARSVLVVWLVIVLVLWLVGGCSSDAQPVRVTTAQTGRGDCLFPGGGSGSVRACQFEFPDGQRCVIASGATGVALACNDLHRGLK